MIIDTMLDHDDVDWDIMQHSIIEILRKTSLLSKEHLFDYDWMSILQESGEDLSDILPIMERDAAWLERATAAEEVIDAATADPTA